MSASVARVLISLLAGTLAPFVIVLPLVAATSDQPLQILSWFDVKLTGLIGAPFTVTGSFLVVGPAYSLQRGERSELRKAVVVLWISAIAGFLMLARKSVVKGKSVSVRVDLGGRRQFKKK